MDAPQRADKFPAFAILLPPIGSLVCVAILRLIVHGDNLKMNGVGALGVLGLVAFLWFGVVIELVALPLGLVRLQRKQAARTAFRTFCIFAGGLYLVAFAWWLARS